MNLSPVTIQSPRFVRAVNSGICQYSANALAPRTQRFPISPSRTSSPLSSTILTSTRHGETAAPRLAFPRTAGNEHVQHLRRTNSVEDFDSELPLPCIEDFSGQRFTC